MAGGCEWGEGQGFPETLARVAETPQMTGGEEEGVRPLVGRERWSKSWCVAGRPTLWHSREWAGGPGRRGRGRGEILSRWADKADRWERGCG